MAMLDDQLLLHDAAAFCGMLLLRPGKLPDEPAPPVFGEELDRPELIARLGPALELAWPGHPTEIDAVQPFLEEALERISATAKGLSRTEAFVPAALFPRPDRELVFEHLKLELLDVRGGIATEELWEGFDAPEATAPIKQLTLAGLRIKLRALGAFLVGEANRFEDELAAAEFFEAGRWEGLRDNQLCDAISSDMRRVNKQFAHLTLTRPLPEERGVHAPASYAPSLKRLVTVFDQFTEAVDQRLLPDWWADWFRELSDSLN
jgi:hypothetical protein